MAKILKMTDRIPVKIDDMKFKLSPLSYIQKMEIQEYMAAANNGDMMKAMKGASIALKYSIKDVEGIEDYAGKPFKLDFDSEGFLSDACVDNLLNLEQSEKLITTCAALLNGLPQEDLLDPRTGEKIDGISFGEVEGN